MHTAQLTRQIKNDQSRLSLIELLVAMAIFVIAASGITFVVVDAVQATQRGKEYSMANWYNQQAFEAVTSIRNRGWQYLTNGTHGVTNVSGQWEFAGASDTLDAAYSRRVIVESVERDGNDDIVDTGGTDDIDTKHITVQTTWEITPSRSGNAVSEMYLTNWRSKNWEQTTQADFNQGTVSNTSVNGTGGGAVELAPGITTASRSWNFDTPAEYSYNPALVEVITSYAQLKSIAISQTGGTINPGFNTTLNPWAYQDWNQNSGEVNVVGSRQTSGGNPGAYARIRIPQGNSDEVGGFFLQSFAVTANNATSGNVIFDWRVSDFNNTPIILEVFAFLDTVPGEPIQGTEIWSSGPITGTTAWSTQSIDVTPLIALQGTYYLKLATWVETPAAQTGRFDISFDNASAYWEKASQTYNISGPTIQPIASHVDANLLQWTGFVETAQKDLGGEIYYQLSNNNGTTWQWWNGSAWAAAGATQYNTASTINSSITSFSTVNRQILFRAFLVSNGTAQVRLDTVRVEYLSSIGSSYVTSGTFDSQALDTNSTATIFNYIAWNAVVPINTTLDFQIRTADTQANLSSATWVGSDGTSGTRFTTSPGLILIDPGSSGTQWIQWRAFFTGNGTATPRIDDVMVNYET